MNKFYKLISSGLLIVLILAVSNQTAWCYDYLMTAPFSHTSTTVGAGNDCIYRSGQDRMYAVFIPYPGTWRFSLCGTNPTWDAYIYLATQECNLTILASNDNGCGALIPTMDVVFARGGFYFLDVEPNLAGGAGAAYTLDVTYQTSTCSPGVVRTTGASACQGIPTFTTNGNYYLRSNTAVEPFGYNTNITAMNDVFGSGKWTSGYFETINASQVFSASTKFVFMEGSSTHAIEFRSFLTTNLTTIQNWVSAGGNLLMNVAPEEGTGFSLGFGGVTLTYPVNSATGVAVATLVHPIFAGPVSPCTTSFTGTNFSNATVAGGSIISLMNGSGGASILAWKASGTGRVYFSTITMPDMQAPTTEAQNLRRNIIAQASGQYAFGGQGFSYIWSDGSTTQTISPGVSATYSVTVTNASGCSGTASAVVFASPTTTLTGSPAAPYCGVNSTTLTASSVGAGGNAGYAVTTIANNFVACGATPGPNGDDVVGGPYNIGFNFVFYGQVYSQFGISTNGNIQLGSSGYNPTPNNVAFPNNIMTMPTIAIAWDDLDAGAADIKYQTTGTAPNRILVVCFNNLTHFGGNVSGQIVSGRILLYETTGVFEIHTSTSNDFVSASQGYQLNSTTGASLRDGAWGASDARRMTPITQFSYSWTGGTTNQTLVVNTDGTYNVSVTEAATGCTASATQNIIFSPGVTASLSGGPNFSCLGGLITATPSAGVSPFAYLWSNGATTQSASIAVSGIYTVTVTDAGGCTATLSETVTVAPGVTVTISGGTDFCTQGVLTAVPSGGTSPYTYLWSDGSTADNITVSSSGTYSVTVFDAIGCSATATQAVTVTPIPVFSIADSPGAPYCPPVTVTLSTGLNAPTTFLWGGGETTSSITINAPGTYTVTATNGGICTASATSTIIFDNEFPVIVCPSNITLNADAGVCTSANVTYLATATDNCGTPSLSYSTAPGSTFNVGTTSVTATATDAAGNTATCTFNVTIMDNQNPVVTCPGNFNLPNDVGLCSRANVTYTATATDNCGIASITYSPASGSTLNVGPNTITVTATDANSRTSTCSFRVTIQDQEAPAITCPADVSLLADAGLCSRAAVAFAATATDNCGTASLTYSPASGSTFNVGITAVLVTATDPAGRTSTCSFTVFIADNDAPVITCPGDITVNNNAGICGAVVTYAVSVTDDCSPFPAVAPTIPGFTYMGAINGSAFYQSQSTFTYRGAVNDAILRGGHLATIATAAENALIAAALGGDNSYIGLHERFSEGNYVWMTNEPLVYTNWEPGEPNNLGGTETNGEMRFTGRWNDKIPGFPNKYILEIPLATLQTGLASGATFPVGTTTVTWMAVDASCHTSTCSFNVTVIDVEAPVITCPSNIVVNGGAGACSGIVTFAATATDNCGTATLTYSPASGSTFPIGNTTVTATANDGNGNTSTCSFTVTVIETQVPTITCPSNISVNADAGVCNAIVTYSATATDNCGTPTISYSPASGSTFNFGTTTVTATANDGNGNTASCSFLVTVNDAQAPTIACPGNITLNVDAGFCSRVNVTFTATATDNCSIPIITYSQASGSTFNAGVNTVTATATDASGNTSTCTFRVTIVDNQAPTITCPINFALNVDPGQCSKANVTYSATAVDSCGIASITYNPASGSTLPVGINTVTVTATDVNGLTSTCSFRVTIFDNESPVIVCPLDVLVTADTGQCIATNVTYTAAATDNCAVASITFNPVSGSTFNVGISSVTVTATDVNGRTSTCTFIVTVLDHAAPVVTCPGDITVNNTPGICGALVTYEVTVTDDCAQFPALPAVIPGFVYIGAMDGSAFYRSTGNFDYDGAVNNAQLNGGHLATIASSAQNTMITAGLAGNRAYIGLHERPFENNFVWMTGEPLIFTRWEGGEPNNQSGNETCVELRTTSLWADVNGTALKRYVLEVPYATLQTGLPSGATFPVGVTTVAWMASDESGYTSTCTFNVTVIDIEPPAITCPANITANNAPGTCGVLVTYTATATDICGDDGQLNSPIASTTSENGNMFDITATKDVTIQSFEGNLTNGTVNYQIYYRAGTHVGHENIAGDWILIGTVSVTSNGINTYTPIPLPVNITIPAGQTYGFYLTTTSGSTNNRFHTGTLVGNPFVSDGNIMIREGIAKDYPFGTALTPRVWEGIVHYTYYEVPVTFTPPSGSTFAVGVNTVTATASDTTGNTATCTFTVTVNDVEAPTITCPTNIVVNADAGVCTAIVMFAATGTDNCGTPSISYNPASGSTFNFGTTTVTATANDGNGNTVSCSFTVTVNDNQPPVFGPTVQFAAPALALANVGEASEYSLAYTLDFPNIANWDLPNQIPYTTNNAAALATTPFDRIAYMMELNGQWVWVSMNAFTADVSLTGIPTGATNFQQTVSDMNVFAGGGAPVTTGSGIATGNIELGANCYATGTGTGGIGGNGVTYDFNDQFIVNSPNCYGSFQVHNWAAQQTILAANGWSFGGALDLGIGNQVGGSGNPDWTYAGNAANFGTKRLYVLVRPSSGCVSNITTNAAAGLCTAVVTFAASATDNCGTPTMTYSPASGSTFNLGTTTVTATAADGNGNTATCTFTVTVNDNQAPSISCPGTITVNTAAGQCSANVTFVATATDICGSATIAYSPASGSSFGIGNTIVVATATDNNGNTATCSFTVTVIDNQAPTITCAANVTAIAPAGLCNANVTVTAPTVTDNCGAFGNALSFDGTNDYAIIPNATGINGQFGANRITLETWIYLSANNVSNPMVIGESWLGDGVVRFAMYLQGNNPVAGFYAGGWTSAISPTPIPLNTWTHIAATYDQSNIRVYMNGVQVASLAATAALPNGTEEWRIFRMWDLAQFINGRFDEMRVWNVVRTPAQILAAMNSEIPTNTSGLVAYYRANQGVAGANNAGITTLTDVTPAGRNANLSGFALNGAASNFVNGHPILNGLTLTNSFNGTSDASGTYPVGTTTVTWTSSDAAGNTATCTQMVTVIDNQAPTFPTFPANLTMACGSDTSTLFTGFPTVFDFCGTATVTYSDVVTGNTCSEVITRTFRATDQSGNVFTRVQTITRVDFDAPTYTTFPATINVSADPGICGAVVTWAAPTVADNCSAILSLTYSQNPGTVFPVGTTTVIVTVRDVCNNARNRNLLVVVTDNQAPAITCPSNISVNGVAGACSGIVTYSATATDNCGTANLSYSPASGSTFNFGTTTVTATANDGNGNTSTCSFTVTVSDNQVPTITCPSNISVNADAGVCNAIVTYSATATDNCGTATLSYSPASGSTFPTGTSTVTATANDGNGNISTCSFTVTVTDNQAPSVACPGDQMQNGAGQINLADYTGMATASDLCGAVTLTQSPVPNTPYIGNQTVVVILTATDLGGNTATCAFNVVITTVTCGPANRIYVDDNAVGANNGTSWDDAFASLQSALAAAVSGTEIWVKQGTYKPTATLDRMISFELKPNVAIYGGFPQNATCATLFEDRDPATYSSVLSGDIGTIGAATDNSVCLVRAYNVGNNTILDGFTIRDAYCVSNQRPAPAIINADGVGVVSSPTINQCIFTSNYNANNGGALYIRALNGGSASPTVSNTAFRYNVASFDGGAVYTTSKLSATINPLFDNCIFEGNTANADGGAIYQWLYAFGTSTLTFNDCSFTGNIALSDGGAIWNYGLKSTSFLVLNNTNFNNNTATRGAGIFQTMTTSSASVALTACVFEGNTASGDGGGMYIYGDKANTDYVNAQRTMFRNNTATRGGGAFLYNLGGSSWGTGYFENCIFYDNHATNYGGGLGVYARNLSAYNTTLLSCTFHGNDAVTQGGAVSNYITTAGSISNMNAQNCIVWDNPAGTGKAFYGQNIGASTSFNDGILDFASCAANETGSGAFSCSGLLATNPLFVNAGIGDLHLTNASPAIDAGGPGSIIDYDGAARPAGNGFDIGAFEYDGIVPRMASQDPFSTQHSPFSIYPNPTSGKFTVAFDKVASGRVEVLDLQGRILMIQEVEYAKSVELSMSGRASGTYLVKTVTENGSAVQKLVVRLP